MIKIKKGEKVLTVTHGAFENFYKHIGYEPVGATQTPENSGRVNTHPTDGSHVSGDAGHVSGDDTDDGVDGDDGEDDTPEGEVNDEVELSEIPLSEMSFDQLCEYADELELDHDGMRSKKELRALIREHLK